jgi:uncharacterized protein (DUF488 family)
VTTAPLIRTVGHGTLSAEALAELLVGAGVEMVVDVRRFPGSRRHPQFGRDEMERWLADAGLGYRWLPALGGRRSVVPGSPNVGLRHRAFQGYADHMATGEFARGMADLVAEAAAHPLTVLCSEAVWWRCHRRLVADHLVLVEDQPVEHLFHDGRLQAHPVTPVARRVDGLVVYDVGEQQTLLGDEEAPQSP